ncbi:MAG: D-tyrosyl-tRNA(Tyr) deacylase [Pirellulales bacterium]|nr:D-tyrosyl-tRNA(Tyr) deacylase [Pirellulales bacterium]
MRACVQRVSSASVDVTGRRVGEIGRGLVVLLGVAAGDRTADGDLLARKIIELRIFDDDEGRMNRSLLDVGGGLLVVSQFTLLADCRRGRRPSYTSAAEPALAEALYEQFVTRCRESVARVATGVFREHMDVALVNDGPVTIWLDTRELSLSE